MAIIYVKEQGVVIQKAGERLLVSKNNNRLLDIPVFQLDNLAVIGNVQVTTQALHMLMENGVDISYLTNSGKYLGHTAAEASKNIFLRFEQYRFYLDEDRRLEMAKIITGNKINNQLQVIGHHRFPPEEKAWREDVSRMKELLDSLSEKETPNEVLGVEGICSQIYFRSFGKMITGDYTFTGRNRRPPRDPVNVILSLGYTLLTKEVSNSLDAESFESYLGFLHGIRYGRKSLALDLVEEFRQPVIDRLTLLLFNRRMLGKYDFEFSEDGAVTLTEEGFKKFCVEYERWMNGKNSLSGETSFRGRIREQTSVLKKSVCQNQAYTPYGWRG